MADQIIQATEEMVGAGHATKADTLNRALLIDHNTDGTHEKLTLGSDANGDMYYRASGALARLAKGTANYKLFMNAGATAPEWANGMKVINSTRALDGATADVAYTGVGFKPSGFIALAQMDMQDKWCIGIAGGGNSVMISRWGSTSYLGAALMVIYDADVAKNQIATIKSYDSDGVTITWTRNGATAAGTITFALMCFR